MLPASISQLNECICALIKSLVVLNFNVTWYWEINQGGEQNTDMYIHRFLKFLFHQSNTLQKKML